jgi:hypothetical protein
VQRWHTTSKSIHCLGGEQQPSTSTQSKAEQEYRELADAMFYANVRTNHIEEQVYQEPGNGLFHAYEQSNNNVSASSGAGKRKLKADY